MKLPKFIRTSSFFYKIYNSSIGRNALIKKGTLIKYDSIEEYLSIAPPLFLNKTISNKPRVGIVRDGIFYKDYVSKNAFWLSYERFLKNNLIPYSFYDILSSDWLKKVNDFDIIVWHVGSTPSLKYIAESKIYILEKLYNKVCFPSYHEIWQYEDKNRAAFLYEALDLPRIPTYVINSKEDATSILSNLECPFIGKTLIGAGSLGVRKIKSTKEGIAILKKVFSVKGLVTQFPYYRQKDNYLFQKFIDGATYDLRVMIVGNMAFGYYRFPTKGDFRASGSGNVQKKEIPKEAIDLAIEIKRKLNSRLLGVDLLFSNKDNKYLIIETSLFNQLDTSEQLAIDGIPGYYDISNNKVEFRKGRFWIHELVMQLLVEEWKQVD